jgi:Tfp pilus assembly protein PilF
MKYLAQLATALLMVPSLLGQAQNSARNINPNVYTIVGRILGTFPDLPAPFEVGLTQAIDGPAHFVLTDSLGRYRFTGLTRGTYYVIVNTRGFKEVRQRVDVVSPGAETTANIILEPEDEKIIKPVADFSGEELDVIDVAELGRSYPPNIAEGMKVANKNFESGNYAKASAVLADIVIEAPNLYQARRLLGMTYQKEGRYADAESEYRKAAELRQVSAAPWINLGGLYLEAAEASASKGTGIVRTFLNQALASLDAAVKLKPDAPFAYYLLGVTYYRSGFYEDAEDHLKHAIELAPNLLDARLALANVYIKMQEWPNVVVELDAYLSADPKSQIRAQVESLRSKVIERSQVRLR